MQRLFLLMCVIALGCGSRTGTAAEEPEMATPAEHPDDHAAAAAEHAMAGMVMEDPHLRMTAVRAPAPGDSARAAAVLAVLRRDLDRYRDIRAAEADGFREFIPAAAAPLHHLTKLRWAFESRNSFDPSRPTSLLYRRRSPSDSSLELVGAMFTAPAGMSEDELNARLPLSVARWHQHVNWCLPPLGQRDRWRETRNGAPVFGPKSPIATEAACAAVGGRFRPRLFGWMVHVMAFSGADPWNSGH
jgi:hypothetical protein